MSIRQTMLDHAYHLLRQGQRPTADALVATCGGSKATATQVLGEFWSSYLPPRLASEIAPADAGPPGTVLALAREVWQRALDFADQALQTKMKAALEQAEEVKEQLTAERDALDREHEEMAESTRAAERRADEATTELVSLRAQHAEILAMNAAILRERDEMNRLLSERASECQRLVAAMTTLTEERAALVAQHVASAGEAQRLADARLEDQRREASERLAEIKGLYHESESRLRVELDAARTDANKARQEAQKVREGWEGRVEAERVRAARELAERLAEAKATSEGQIATLRELLLRPVPGDPGQAKASAQPATEG